METEDKIKKELFLLLSKVREQLPIEDVENISNFIEYNEYGLGYETLCTQICEYRISIDRNFYESLKVIADLIRVDSSYYFDLLDLVKK